MRNVRLMTPDGEFIVAGRIGPGEPPEVLRWSDRTFVYGATDSDGVAVYTEALAAVLIDVDQTGHAPTGFDLPMG